VTAAGDGDSVDLNALSCSSITLSQGAIPVLLDNLTLTGPGAAALTIDGAGADRVLVHPGYGTLTVQGLTLRNGAARVAANKITGGACIASAGYVMLDHSRVSDCYGSGEGVYGGGIFAFGLLMYTSTLSGAVAFGRSGFSGTASFGGGAYVEYARIVDSTISANRAAHTLAYGLSGYDTGGGIFCDFGGTILSSTIDNNYSTGIGGGISAFGGGVIDVIDSTISGNVARNGTGGGIDIRTFINASIRNSTISGNHAGAGGGVYLRGAPQGFVLQSTVISGNVAGTGGADAGASPPIPLLGANNLVIGVGAGVTLPADTLHVDPLLQPLADNGGPTRTHALLQGSPAIDAGNNFAGLATDQRGTGFPRVVGAAADIGAFEGFVVAAPPPVALPAASTLMLSALWALLAAIGAAVLWRRQRAVS
jgi:hypothetical protein